MMTTALHAAEVRVHDRDGGVRMVVDFAPRVLPSYTLKKIDDVTLELQFDRSEHLSLPPLSSSIPEIKDIRILSVDENKPLRLWIQLSSPVFKDDLRAGSRLVLDFKKDDHVRDTKMRSDVARTQDEDLQKTDALPSAIQDTFHQSNESTGSVLQPSSLTTDTVKPNDQDLKPVDAIDPNDPPLLTFTSLSPFGAAAYTHNNRLWVVVDDPEFMGTPQVAGKGAEHFKTFEQIKTADGTIFYTVLPDGIRFYRGEGGDLSWRIVFAPQKQQVAPREPERMTEPDKKAHLLWPIKDPTKVISFNDPITGDPVVVATVKKSSETIGDARRFPDFKTPHTIFGAVFFPRSDDVSVKPVSDGIDVSKTGGMALSPLMTEDPIPVQNEKKKGTDEPSMAQQHKAGELPPPPDVHGKSVNIVQDTEEKIEPPKTPLTPPFFRFDRWAMGGLPALINNENALVFDLATTLPEDRAGGLMSIGKMYLSSDRGAEALGYFDLASESQSRLLDSPEFLAVRGAARTLIGQYDLAYDDLKQQSLDGYPDIDLWRSFVLAHLQDWQQAAERLKKSDTAYARQYPRDIGLPMLLTFAEVMLRAGKITDAQKFMASIDPGAGTLPIHLKTSMMASYDYLRGEAARQSGKKEEARKFWAPLVKSPDDLYRARARLALTILDYESGKLKVDGAIDVLESLRYGWRGDELEASINARLGDMYLDKGDYIRGLNVLRDAAELVPGTEMGKRITANMTEAFRAMFIGAKRDHINPLDAITVYEKFSELMPAGDEANKLTFSLIDRLVDVDLPDRAAAVLKDMIDHRLSGSEKLKAEMKLAAIYLLSDDPKAALHTLNKTTEKLTAMGDPDQIQKETDELSILRAHALFKDHQVDAALNVLEDAGTDPDVLKNRADFAWQAGKWSQAVSALQLLVDQMKIQTAGTIPQDQADLILKWAVAINLSGDRGVLSQVRTRFEDVMAKSPFAREFEIITRTHKTPTLADRQTLDNLVSEVDLFGSFLDHYKKMGQVPLAGSGAAAPTSSVSAPLGTGQTPVEAD